MFCEIVFGSDIFNKNQKSELAKFEYVVKVFTYTKSPDHRLKNHVRCVKILLSSYI